MYQYFEIKGNKKLTGQISIDGAKNSALPILIATALVNDKVILDSVPQIQDIQIIASILERMGSKFKKLDENQIEIDNTNLDYKDLIYDDVSKLRASYYFLGVLVGKYHKAKILLPGGCFLGPRPIDLHLKGLKQLGCNIEEKKHGNYDLLEVEAPDELKGTTIFLDFPSVGATINLILAAVNAQGETILENAAQEPEIVDLTNLLRSMGLKITGAGTQMIKIQGKQKLQGCRHQINPDRIEAGTYLLIGSLLGENYTLTNIIPEHIESLIAKLKESGIEMEVNEDSITIPHSNYKELKPLSIKTGVYPSFPTDLQQIISTYLTQVNGESKIIDTIYIDRFRNCEYLNLMGADIEVGKSELHGSALIKGGTKLVGNEVVATDLRAGASLIFAGLLADGTTKILDIKHILRGYSNIEQKLKNVGADISLIKIEEANE